MTIVGRFAPSPTGRMHVGVARTSLAAWLDARARGGRILLRIEDIDTPRVVSGAAEGLMEDLAWLGLDWDGDPMFQSARFAHYQDALDRLMRLGRTYRCTCSRKEIAQASSAPHGPTDDGPRYPGTCRDLTHPKGDIRASVRFRTEPGDRVIHVDRLFGRIEEDVHETVGDFVLRRSDGFWAYQLAVTVDDWMMGVSCVVRGRDLLASTPRQVFLRSLLDPAASELETLHIPLILGHSGKRLAKRDGAVTIAEFRAAGMSPKKVVGALAASLGLVPPGEHMAARDLIPHWRIDRLPKEDVVWSE